MHLDFMRDSSKVMPIIDSPSEVRSIRIWHCKYTSLASLADCINLEVLVVATFPDESFECISGLKKLRYLSVMHLPNVTSLSVIADLHCLESLSLSTLPSWDSSGKVTTISSLKPLATLPNLKNIELFGIRPESKSPMELVASTSIESVKLSKFTKKLAATYYSEAGVVAGRFPAPVFDDAL